MKYTVEENGNVRVVEDDTPSSDPSNSQYIPPPYTRKKGNGCGCFVAILILIIIALASYFAYNWWTQNIKNNNYPVETSFISSSSQSVDESSQESTDSDYIIVGSDSRYISESELEGLTSDEVCLARNEIFARHGRIFTTDWIREYFMSRFWYEERYSPDEFDNDVDSFLNEYEKENVKIIKSYEKKWGYQ